MIAPAFDSPTSLMVTVVVVALTLGVAAFPDWFGMIRTVMMMLGGIVVVAIVLVVAVAIVSGVLGMIGRLRKKR
ncbi:MAG: hypothetical protein AB1Z65_01815 [Candidatus Sulfomarinibacteraceae bacterium]